MAQSTKNGPLASIYEQRIGDATNANEVLGYWVFLVGVVLGFMGLLTYYMTEPATMGRGVGYALAALAPALLMSGAVLRFPLRKAATTLVGVGLVVTLVSITWFLVIFPEGWSLTTGSPVVIMSYVAGLVIIGVAGSIIPLATDARDAALRSAERQADNAKDERDIAEFEAEEDAREARGDARESKEDARIAKELEEKLTADIVGLEDDNSDLRSSKADFELYKDNEGGWRWRLRHDNGNIIADSGEGYSSKAMAKKGLGSVKLNALGGEINES